MSACRKDNTSPRSGAAGNGNGNGNNTSGQRTSDEDSLKFYVWWINESDSDNIPLYYWYDQVPQLNPFSSSFKNADSLLSGSNGIASYPVVNGKKVDKYSFLDRVGSVSGELEGGVSGDFGIEVGLAYDEQNNAHIAVLYCYAGSPAAEEGVQRGWEITALDGNSNMTLDGGTNSKRIVNALYNDPTTTFTFTLPDNTSKTVTLTRASYHINPVLLDTVYQVGSEKVGYFVYNSFISVEGSDNAANAKSEIDNAFSNFKTKGVQDLIVDLRYNGGGAVVSTEYLDDLIAPAAANGQVMYTSKYNAPLTAYFSSIPDYKKDYIDPVDFSIASNNLNLSRVFFIVDEGTASASELTINNLKPYMDVKLVGNTTYGKPVGFIPISIEFVTDTAGYAHVADMYAINDETVNSQGKGQYYDGMTPDNQLTDYVGYNWGDTNDPRLRSIFNYIQGNGFLSQSDIDNGESNHRQKKPAVEYLRVKNEPSLRNPHAFNGMVDYRRSFNFRIKK